LVAQVTMVGLEAALLVLHVGTLVRFRATQSPAALCHKRCRGPVIVNTWIIMCSCYHFPIMFYIEGLVVELDVIGMLLCQTYWWQCMCVRYHYLLCWERVGRQGPFHIVLWNDIVHFNVFNETFDMCESYNQYLYSVCLHS